MEEVKLYDNGLKKKNETKRKTYFFNLSKKRSSKQRDMQTTKLCNKLNKKNPQVYRKKHTLNKADRLILKKIKKCFNKFVANFDRIEKTKNIFEDKKKTFCKELTTLIETSKDVVLKEKVRTILSNSINLEPNKNINHVFDYFNIKGDFRKIIKKLIINKKDIKMDMKKQISVIKLNDKYILEYNKIETTINENIKIINSINLFNCVTENKEFVFDPNPIQLISPSLINASRSVILLLIERVNDINTKNALSLQLIYLNTVEHINELCFVKTLASLIISGSVEVVKTTTLCSEIFKIFHYKNMDIKKYESYMFNYYLEDLARQKDSKYIVDVMSCFLYNVASLNYFSHIYSYVDFDNIDDIFLEMLMLLVPKDDGKQIKHENFIEIFIYIIENKRLDLSDAIKSHIKKNITKKNIFYVFDILKKNVTDINIIIKALKTVEKAENWAKVLSDKIDCTDNILFVCFILRPTTRIINVIKEIKNDDKYCVEQYIGTLIMVYVISKYYLPDSYFFYSLKELLLKIQFNVNLSIICGHILHDLADVVFFKKFKLDIIYEKYNQMYVEYPKNIESDKKYMNVFLFPIDKFENDSKDHYLCLALNKYKKINDSFVKNLGLPYVEAKTKNEKEIRNITDIIFGKYAETIQILRLRHFKYNNINININNNIAINYVNRSPELSSGGEFGTPMGGPVD